MKTLKELLIKVFEGKCERLPGESDNDYLQRCGNDDFARFAKLKFVQRMGTFTRPVIKEKK